MQLFTFFLLILNLFWSVLLHFEPTHSTLLNYLFNLSYGLNFAIASLLSFSYIKRFPLYKTALTFFGVSNLFFFIAQLIWVYYNVIVMSEIPYPGPSDFFWLMFYPLIGTGFLILLKNLKAQLNLADIFEFVVVSSIIFLIISSFLTLNSSQEGLPVLTQVLNYLYPVFDSILIGLSVATLHSQAGQLKYHLLYFIFGFATLVIADTLFAYQTTIETYWNGNSADLIFSIAGFFLLMGIIHLPNLLTSKPKTIFS